MIDPTLREQQAEWLENLHTNGPFRGLFTAEELASPNRILVDGDVRQLRQMYATGEYSWEKLGALFGVSKRCAGRIVKGESYADVR